LLFPSAPTVHMTDETTIAENLAPFPWIAETARSFFVGPLGLSPVGLRPPPSPPPRFGGEDLGSHPRYVDVRQASLLAAGWTACHIGQVARAGFVRATYYQSTGWRGLMYGEAGPGLPDIFPGQPGSVFPLYHVFADIAELAGAQVVGTRSSAPISVSALALRREASTRVLVANLTRDIQAVRLPEPLHGGRLRRLDQTNVELATRDPESFRDAPAIHTTTRTLVLAPHELARIDVGG
jgi:D-apionolactonase